MKYMILIACLLLIVGCNSNAVPVQKEKTVSFQMVGYTEQEETVTETLEFSTRSTEHGFTLDTIEVNKGDEVTIFVTNSEDEILRFSITGYNLEDFVHPDQTRAISFVADKSGVFDFGDESRANRLGRLIVN